jgi:PncC family amidohydrolase
LQGDIAKPVPAFPTPAISQRAERIASKLIKEKLTVATAESITCGLLAASITSVPGSSAYFLAGIDAYSNESKRKFLEIPEAVIRDNGAVSKECSALMAENVARVVGADIGVSTTGIAGPSGGSPQKPVGLVFFSAWGKRQGILTWESRFSGSRHEITLLSAESALDILIELIGA